MNNLFSGNINQTLMALRNCLEMLRENQKSGGNKVKYIIYNSKASGKKCLLHNAGSRSDRTPSIIIDKPSGLHLCMVVL